ncbi:MAG: exosortase/archaeosortase family protein [Acidobacteriaceae bacterium]|nr:exosortase/archaeosortase family protein [Acidobacteriaceae bacterium]MBV8570265.1 exosortase/archaeosortase family protein [Acidobacteriaceae bacterium]
MTETATPQDRKVGERFDTAEPSWPPAWLSLLWFGGLLALSYAFVLFRLGQQWLTDDDMSHGMFVPPLVAYIIWQRWPGLRSLPANPNPGGLLLMVAGGCLLCIGPPSLPTFVFMSRLGFVFSLVGLILFVRGRRTVAELAYPLLLILFMIPFPGFVFEKLTLPLQFLASILSENLLSSFGYSVLREGNVLRLPDQTLNVVEACSGLRSLLSLSFLAQAYAYLFDRRPWMRLVLGAVIVPIAVLANGCRIAISAMAGAVNPEWGQGLYHEITGWAVFLFTFIFLLIAHWVAGATVRLFENKPAQNELS